MRKTYIIFSISLLLIGFGVFMAPSKADAYYGGYYQQYYDIPSYSTDYPGYHGYRYSSYPQDNSYITPRANNSYNYNSPRNNYNYNYNYYYNNNNYYNYDKYEYVNNDRYSYDDSDNDYYRNGESCYGYGC